MAKYGPVCRVGAGSGPNIFGEYFGARSNINCTLGENLRQPYTWLAMAFRWILRGGGGYQPPGLVQTELVNFDDDQGHVVFGRAATPGGDAIDDLLLHFR